MDLAPLGKLRTFLNPSLCRKPLGLQIGKTYLIMGTPGDILITKKAQT